MRSADDDAPSRSQTDVVVDDIRTMILRGDLVAGARLPREQDLAASLGVSRSSLREGVRALAVLGILETRQGDGTYVTGLDAATLLGPLAFLVDVQSGVATREIAALRRLLESEAAARAALHITQDELTRAEVSLSAVGNTADLGLLLDADLEFHAILAGASRNAALQALIGAFSSRLIRARSWRAISEHGAMDRAHAEHRAILAAVRSGDPDRARLTMAVHLLGVEDSIAKNPERADPPAHVVDATHQRWPAQ